MTTVVCDRHGMAADSYITDGTRMQKVHRIADTLVGFSGPIYAAVKVLQWMKEGRRGMMPALDDTKLSHYDFLILRKDGIYAMDGNGVEILLEQEFAAIGSGSDVAVGALAAWAEVNIDPPFGDLSQAGTDLRLAVEIAARYDSNTKLPVHYVPLKRVRGSR